MQKLNDDLDKYTNLLEENQQRISDLETQLDMESEKVSNLLQIDESEKNLQITTVFWFLISVKFLIM